MTAYDFALQWLDYLDVEVYNNNKRILEYTDECDYNISRLDTKVEIGEEIGEDDAEEEYTVMYYNELNEIGLGLKLDTNFRWRPRQRGGYRLIVLKSNSQALGYTGFKSACTTSSIYVQHDFRNRRIRLMGNGVIARTDMPIDSGVGPWINYDGSEISRAKKKKDYSPNQLFAKLTNNKDLDSVPQYTKIKEIPLILTKEKYIVCMPKTNECQRMIVTGKSGKGKSLLVNGIAGRIFYKWEDRVGWLLDPLNQLYNISLPQDNRDFIYTNNWIGEDPKPIPAVHLYMASRYNLDIPNENVSFLYALSFLEFLNKYQFYVHGIDKYNVGKTVRYIEEYKNKLQHAKSDKDVKEILYSLIPDIQENRGMQSMIYKYQSTFKTIFKDKFTSNLYSKKDVLTELTIKLKENEYRKEGETLKGNPFIMLMEAGAVPVFNIAAARKQVYIRNLLADLMQKIIIHQQRRGNKANRMFIVADELNEIYEEGSGKKRDNATASFIELFRQGRINNIGFLGNTQSLEKLDKDMAKNATHIVCVNTQTAKERKMIGDIYNLPKEIYGQLGDLKLMEVMVFSKEPFIIYDRWGKRKVSERNWFRGKIFPPINYHMPPKKVST